MKNIGILVNTTKDTTYEYTERVCDWIKANGLKPVLMEGTYKSLQTGICAGDMDEFCRFSDLVVVLGGDGTVLQMARECAVYDIAILGINLGTLGYLTDVERTEGLTALKKVIDGEYKIESRMMLEATVQGEDYGTSPAIALNDICVVRSTLSKMLMLDLYVNEEFIDKYRADGLIIATPTGSTAYNLSAGGPILKPDIELIAITPICPHKVYSRPSVISAIDEVNLVIGRDVLVDAVMILDGQEHVPLKPGYKINVKRSQYSTKIIKTTSLGFYDILRKKFYH